MDVNYEKYLIFVGNPGSGKSTLLNGLVDEDKFQSGVSFGQGMTRILQIHKHRGINYGDTPGLSDFNMRKQAALEITTILKMEGQYKLFFTCTLEAGRVRPDDVTTIKLILESVEVPVEYGIIINKIPPGTKCLLENSSEDFERVVACLNCDHRSTLFYYLYQRVDRLEDAPNQVPDHPREFKEFLEGVPYTVIHSSSVNRIKVDEYEDLKKMFETRFTKINQENNQLRDQLYKVMVESESMHKTHSTIGRIIMAIQSFGFSEVVRLGYKIDAKLADLSIDVLNNLSRNGRYMQYRTIQNKKK